MEENKPTSRHHVTLSILLTLLSAFILSWMGYLIALLSADINYMQFVFNQMLVGVIVAVPIYSIQSRTSPPPKFTSRDYQLMIPRSVCALLLLCSMQLAYSTIAIGDASTIINTSPVLVSLLAWFFLHEPCGCLHAAMCAMLMTGLILVIQPTMVFCTVYSASTSCQIYQALVTDNLTVINTTIVNANATQNLGIYSNTSRDNLINVYDVHNTHIHTYYSTQFFGLPTRVVGISAALVASTMTALATVLTRKVKHIPTVTLVLWSAIPATIFSATVLTVLGTWALPSSATMWCYLVLHAVASGSLSFLNNMAVRLGPASAFSTIRLMVVVFSYIWQVSLLHDYPNIMAVCGVVLIVMASAGTGLWNWYHEKTNSGENEA